MNRLAFETSPYLRQHAENPVDWFPWGTEALALSGSLDKPILLSIGYSSCHWCHVMARESFEDGAVASLMNEHFVNIKVDREERPDLDHIYQSAHAMLTGRHGGWPLTLFLAPDGTPFFGGTYFPKESAYGLPGFREILPRISAAYRNSRQEIEHYASRLRKALRETVRKRSPSKQALNDEPVHAALASLESRFDRIHGGFGQAPKFPNPAMLDFCLNHASHAQIALFTLEKMTEGGIHDQIGGGFFRYSVDETWNIPHFEKMLYDNGALLELYADAWAIAKKPLFRDAARGIANWALREMQSPEGGYFSSLDADSEHVEGKFYRWDIDEIESILTPEEFEAASLHFGLDLPPNFEHFHHLRLNKSIEEISERTGRNCSPLLDSAKAKLFAAREKRSRPGRDEKILTGWNALMIGGMARASRIFREESWLFSARAALGFIRENLYENGRLLASFKDGEAKLNAYLDDYAFLLDALLELLQTEFRKEDLDFAMRIADALLSRFEDRNEGGFFFTSHDHETLLFRQKPGEDGAMPSGSGIAALALLRLGHILGEARYLDAAKNTLLLHFPSFSNDPAAFSSLLKALEETLFPPSIVILRSPELREAVSGLYLPHAVVLAIPENIQGLPQTLEKSGDGAWACKGLECLPPVHGLAELLPLLARR